MKLSPMGVKVMVFNATFYKFFFFREGPFYWWRKPEYLGKKTLTCHKSLTNLYRVHLAISRIPTHNFSGDRH